VFLLVGLLGGAHCLGMCGPLVSTYADRMRSDAAADGNGGNGGPERTARAGGSDDLTVRQVRQHALFNLGRTASYAAIGGLFGLAGSLAFVTGRTVTTVADDVHALTGLVVGAVVIAIGVRYALRLELQRIPVPGSKPPRGRHRPDRPRIDAWVGNWRIVGLGAAHGLFTVSLAVPGVPVRVRAGQRARRRGRARRARLGTVPALFLFGTVFGSVSVDTRMRLHRALGVAFVALGYILLQHGLATLGVPLPHPPILYYSPL